MADIIGRADQDIEVNNSLYVTEPGFRFPSRLAFDGSLTIKLEGGFVIDIPPHEMSRPLRGIDANGKRVLQENVTEVAVFHEANVLGKMAFGKAFLSQVSESDVYLCPVANNQEVYLQVDYNADKFRLAPLTASAVAPNPVSFGANSTIECVDGGGMDAKTIGFTVAFSILAAILLGIGAFWYFHRRRRPDQKPIGNGRARTSDPELVRLEERQPRDPIQQVPSNPSRTSELSGQGRRPSELASSPA